MGSLRVSNITLGGWGQQGGIQIGDIIVSCRGQEIQSQAELNEALIAAAPGSRFVVRRYGHLIECTVGRGDPGFTTTPVDVLESSDSRESWSTIPVTTTPSIDGYRVEKILDVVSSECVFGINLFKDVLSGVRDLVGGRSSVSQEALRAARKMCIDVL